MIQAVIFDLDGVLVTTDNSHYEAWKQMADEEGIYFDRDINQRLRGVSRMESLEIILERAEKTYTNEEKTALATRKNNYYVALIKQLNPSALLPGALDTVNALKEQGIKVAIGSSSKNAPTILRQVGIADLFDAVADGNHIIFQRLMIHSNTERCSHCILTTVAFPDTVFFVIHAFKIKFQFVHYFTSFFR